MALNLPPQVIRAGLRSARPLFASPKISLPVKRRLVDALSAAAWAPKGTSFPGAESVAGVPVERVLPPGGSDGATLLYLHGGGYALGSARGYRGFVAGIAAAARMEAVIPDYRRSPEHPYPSALEDVLAVYRSLLDGGTDPGSVVIAGDSAGGGLTVAAAMALRDSGTPLPAGLGLLSPWMDLAADAARIRKAARDPLIIPAMTTEWAAPYIAGGDPADPLISPVHGDVAGLPPIVMHTAGDDPIGADAEKFEARLAAEPSAGVLEHRRFANRWHVFHLQAGFLADADTAVAEFGSSLARLAQQDLR